MEEKDSKMQSVKEKMAAVKEFILDHGKIFMPIVLVLCVGLTIFVAINANKADKLAKAAEEAAMVQASAEAQPTPEGVSETTLTAPEYALLENTDPEINKIITDYYDALAKGDLLTVGAFNGYLNDIEKIRLDELSKYIESYPELTIYTKPGLMENTYIVYVVSKVKMEGLEELLPGMQTYYVGKNDDGTYFINEGIYDETVYEYIKNLTVQDDVVDLNNRVVVEYNDLLAENEEVNEYVAYLNEKINEEVGEILASMEATDVDTDEITQQVIGQDDPAVVVTKVRATEVVNIRDSDSELGSKIGKAAQGQEFELIEQKGNGWSEISYEGSSAFIKSDYLEAVQTVTIGTDEPQNDEVAAGKTTEKTEAVGKVSINDSGVRVRKEPNTDAEILVTLYTGEKLDLIESMSSGWSKVKYKNDYGYVKSEFLTEE